LYEKNSTEAQELIRTFREVWKDQKDLLSYLNKNYFGPLAFEAHHEEVSRRQKSWMLCYRQEVSYSSIDTNNYIESWHNTLKRHFFRDKQQRRLDTVIYTLAIMAVPHFQQKCIRSIVNVGRMNPAQRKELHVTDLARDHIKTRESRGYVGAYMKQKSDDALYVESFTNIAEGYNIKIDFSKSPIGHITQCSCMFFYNNKSCCKHIALVQIELPHIKLFRADLWEHQANFHLGILQPDIQGAPGYLTPDVDHITIGMQRLGLLEELRDKKAEYPLRAQVEAKLKELIDLFEPSFPRLPGQNLNFKRQRQRY
jgi:hypothetical protein